MTLNRMSELLRAELNKKRSLALLNTNKREELLEVAEALRLATELTERLINNVSVCDEKERVRK